MVRCNAWVGRMLHFVCLSGSYKGWKRLTEPFFQSSGYSPTVLILHYLPRVREQVKWLSFKQTEVMDPGLIPPETYLNHAHPDVVNATKDGMHWFVDALFVCYNHTCFFVSTSDFHLSMVVSNHFPKLRYKWCFADALLELTVNGPKFVV